MNTLTLIRKQIQKAAAVHDAQITHTAYRGVEYDQRCVETKSLMGLFAIAVAPTPSDSHGSTTSCRTNVPSMCSIHWYDLW